MIAIFFVILLGGALTAGSVVYERGVRSPLEEDLLSLPGVEAASVEPDGGWRSVAPSALRVRLGTDADLEELYPRIEERVRAAVGSRAVPLILEDRRTPALADALAEMKFAVEEALATGAFRGMVEELDAIGAARGLDDVQIGIDRRFLYITLHQGDAYLHHIVPRSEDGAAGPIASVLGTGIGEEVSSDG